jgi:SAM-dependent methyltransferase
VSRGRRVAASPLLFSVKRTSWKWLVLAGAVLAVIAVLPILEGLLRRVGPPQLPEEQLSPLRRQFLTPERIVQLMRIPQGAQVLDLGAGDGLFTLLLSRATGDTGHVFATDIDTHVIRYLTREIKRNAVKNVTPVLVRDKGCDPFYQQHSFDMILASEVLREIDQPQAFFTQLQPSLKPETGRLWIILGWLDPDFAAVEFGNFAAARAALQPGSVGALLLGGRLSAEVRTALASERSSALPVSLQAAVVADLNRILNDPTLWPEVARLPAEQKSFLLPRRIRLTESLSAELAKTGAFAPGARQLDETTLRMVRILNRMVIQDALKTDMWEQTLCPGQWPLSWDHLRLLLDYREQTVPLLQATGFELVQEHQLLQFHRIWEFRRAR